MNGWQRRDWLKAGLGLGAAGMLPRAAFAADTLVAATFPGTWNDAQSKILGESSAELTVK